MTDKTHRYPAELVAEAPDTDTPDQGALYHLRGLTPSQAAVLTEAAEIVGGARQKAYGAPEDNFERIARYWQVYFENTGRRGAAVTAADVSPLMRLMKQARLDETPDHRDSLVDSIGYTLTQIRTLFGEE